MIPSDAFALRAALRLNHAARARLAVVTLEVSPSLSAPVSLPGLDRALAPLIADALRSARVRVKLRRCLRHPEQHT